MIEKKQLIKAIKNNLLLKVFFYLIPFALFVFTISLLLTKIELEYVIEKYPNSFVKSILIAVGHPATIEMSGLNDAELLVFGLFAINFVLILWFSIRATGGIKSDEYNTTVNNNEPGNVR